MTSGELLVEFEAFVLPLCLLNLCAVNVTGLRRQRRQRTVVTDRINECHRQ